MNIDWIQIQSAIADEVKPVLTNGTPSFSNQKIDDAIELFKDIVHHKVALSEYSFMPKRLMRPLQRALVEERLPYDSLSIIGTQLESFMKKCLLIKGDITATDILTNRYDFISLYNMLGLNSYFRGNNPRIDVNNLESFRSADQYLFELALARLERNKIHTSDSITSIQFAQYLSNFLTVYIYICLVQYNHMRSIVSSFEITDTINIENSEDAKTQKEVIGYNYLTYSDDVVDLKYGYARSLIIYSLYENPMTINDLADKVASLFNTVSANYYVSSIIGKLKSEKDIEVNSEEVVTLSQKLHQIASSRIKNYRYNHQFFVDLVYEVLQKYSLESRSETVVAKLTEFYSKTYGRSIDELKTGNSSEVFYDTILLKYFRKLRIDLTEAKAIASELLLATSGNDFVAKIAAGHAFANFESLVELEKFRESHKKIVYIDTPVILYALLHGFKPDIKLDRHHKSVDILIDLARNDTTTNIFTLGPYLSEASQQVKLALMLIPLERRYKQFDSRNFFYRYFKILKSLDTNYEDNYEEFLFALLKVREGDYYKKNSRSFISRQLSNVLSYASIEHKYIDLHPDVAIVKSHFRDISSTYGLKEKRGAALYNDAWVVLYLSDKSLHEEPPFFITWDASFKKYREEYRLEFDRNRALIWHQYSPSTYSDVTELSKLKISSESINEEVLAFYDDAEVAQKTKTIFDTITRYAEVDSTSNNQRNRYNKILEIFDNKFSSRTNLLSEEESSALSNKFDKANVTLNRYFSDVKIDEYSEKDLHSLYQDDNKSAKLFKAILDHISENDVKADSLIESVIKIIISE